MPLLAAAAVAAIPSAEAQPRPTVTTTPPPGFADLESPQQTVVDIFYLGRSLGSATATFAPGWLSFERPAEVVGLLPPLKDRPAAIDALSGPLETNVARVCGPYRQPGCGQLDPAMAGIIFDPGRFRVDLFVNPAQLADKAGVKYLPEPPAELSTVHSVAGAFAGSDSNDPAFNLRLLSLLSYGSSRLRSETSVSSKDGLLLDSLSGELDRPGRRYTGGLFRTAPLQIVGERRLYGLGFATSTDMRLDLERAYGNELALFLPRQAQVEILRDGRLLDSRVYEAGNQTLETRNLPEGAYEVTIRIREISGVVREERRFFAKSVEVPPADAPRYVLEVGALGEEDGGPLPELSDILVVHAGTAHRVTDSLALGLDMLASTEQSGLEASGFYLTPLARLRAGALIATDGDYGISLAADGALASLSYNVVIRQVWSGDERLRKEKSDGFARDFLPREGIDFVERTATQLNFSSYYSFDAGPRLGFRALWQRNKRDETYAIGPSLFWTIYDGPNGRIDLAADAAQTERGPLVVARLRWSYDQPRYSIMSEAGMTRQREASSADANPALAGITPTAEALGVWRDNPWIAGDLDLIAGIRADDRKAALRVAADYAGDRGRASLDAEQEFGGTGATRYGGTAFFNLVGSGTAFSIGGRDPYLSGALVSVTGEGDALFEILVDDQPRGRVRVGESVPLLLPEYEVYEIRLAPVDAAFVDFDMAPRAVSLFPGSIARLTWNVTPILVVYGQARGADGTPIANARIDGALNPAFTDALGYFQVELGKTRRLVLSPPSAESCAVTIGEIAPRGDFASIGAVTCR